MGCHLLICNLSPMQVSSFISQLPLPESLGSSAHILCDFPLTGYHGTKPDLVFKLEQGEEPWILSARISHESCAGG